MIIYSAYAYKHAPKELLAKYPKPALYESGQFCLFGVTLEDVTGTPAGEIVSLVDVDLNEEQLNDYIDHLLATLSPAEVQLSKQQAKSLYNSRFKPEKSDGII